MSKRLLGLIQQFLMKEEQGAAKLALAVKKHQGTIQRWINAGRVPNSRDRYRLALACGCSHEEALQLADEGSSEAARETA